MSEKPKFLQKMCKKHGETKHVLEQHRDNYTRYRCLVCRSKAVVRHRQRRKRQLLEIHGGACVICGYNRCKRALSFHHVNPTTKLFSIAGAGASMTKDIVFKEAEKCVLVCANCHAEIESGLTDGLNKWLAQLRASKDGD